MAFLGFREFAPDVGHAAERDDARDRLEVVVDLVAVSLDRPLEVPQLRPRYFPAAAPFQVIEVGAVALRAGVPELPRIAVAAALPVAVGYAPRHFVHLQVVALQDVVDEGLVERVQLACGTVYPVVERRCGELYPGLGVHLHLTVLGDMVYELVGKHPGKEVGGHMPAANHRHRGGSLNDCRRGEVLFPFLAQHGAFHALHPYTRRVAVQDTRHVAADNVIFRHVHALGEFRPPLFRKSRIQVAFGAFGILCGTRPPLFRLLLDFLRGIGHGLFLGIDRLVKERVKQGGALGDPLVSFAAPKQAFEVGYPFGHALHFGLKFFVCRLPFHTIKLLIISEIANFLRRYFQPG